MTAPRTNLFWTIEESDRQWHEYFCGAWFPQPLRVGIANGRPHLSVGGIVVSNAADVEVRQSTSERMEVVATFYL